MNFEENEIKKSQTMKFATMRLRMEFENKASTVNRTSCSMKTVLI
jgi:hypothetical protein